ncbi:RagB/SusD family nutrient uptake outer membrane protein [Mucilaginibacter defluvii]|uniref:RagB/SusD family nutrient uptake outer membrane protein n=1 Tax=Mucilaginibacter defluvii TaxID=1196019 RepID=A0ABP9FK09_9SPHI
MKKINNQYKHSFVAMAMLATLFVSQGCKKSFLDVPLQAQQPSQNFFVNAGDADKAVNSLYGNQRDWNNVAFAPIALESVGSDEAEKGSTPSDATFFNNYDNFTVTAGEGQLGGFWQGKYQSINLANQVLENVPKIQMDAALKNRYLAEAKFMRAYSYFRLVRAFGDVPLRLNLPKDATEFNIPRTPKAQVYAAIEKDLTEAAAALPQSYPADQLGRVTKGAALALHAKVAMYQQKWADVLDLTNQVKGLGYSLFPNFYQSFRVTNENNSESVFEIQAKRVDGNPSASNSQYSQVQGARGTVGGGWGFNVPTQELADAFEDGDPRRAATIMFRGRTTPDGDAVPANADNPMYNMKSYVPFRYFVSGYNEGADQNIRVIRYADVLLMNAEAANELGQTSAALESLEQVRARARQGNNSILPRVTTTNKDQLRLAIWHERQVELAMEFDRYFDVIRQGRAAQVFGPKGWKANKNEVWPIPQNEIDLSAGVLTQNPGY